MRDAFKPLYAEMSDKFEILSISQESLNALTSFIKETKYDFPILRDSSGEINAYTTGATPTNYMVDKWGYFYKLDNKGEPVTSTDVAAFAELGAKSLSATRAIINAAIKRVEDYKEPWDR